MSLKFHRKTPVKTFEYLSNFIKKRLQHRCFPVKFVKFLRTPAKSICSIELFFKMSQNLQENTWAEFIFSVIVAGLCISKNTPGWLLSVLVFNLPKVEQFQRFKSCRVYMGVIHSCGTHQLRRFLNIALVKGK